MGAAPADDARSPRVTAAVIHTTVCTCPHRQDREGSCCHGSMSRGRRFLHDHRIREWRQLVPANSWSISLRVGAEPPAPGRVAASAPAAQPMVRAVVGSAPVTQATANAPVKASPAPVVSTAMTTGDRAAPTSRPAPGSGHRPHPRVVTKCGTSTSPASSDRGGLTLVDHQDGHRRQQVSGQRLRR